MNGIGLHCVDANVKSEYSFSGTSSVNLITLLGHVSFPSELHAIKTAWVVSLLQ